MSGTADPQYPGNASLPREVRDKILSTFRHTLNLFKEGKLDDCMIGCDFILKMDARFAPARQLMEKAKNPAADVDVAALEAVVAETPTRQEKISSVETDRLLVRAAESFNARDFDAAIAAAEQVLKVLPGNHNATEIVEKSQQKKTAAPQFEVARQRAIAALDGKRMGEARSALDKMRSLDAEHPAVTLLERRLTSAAPAPRDQGESTNPGFAEPRLEESSAAPTGDLDNLSLDSLSLDEPAETAAYVPSSPGPNEPHTGPLELTGGEFSGSLLDAAFAAQDTGTPPNLWSESPAALGDLSLDEPPAAGYTPASMYSSEPQALPEPEPPTQEHEIAALLGQGDDAVRAGNRQQAIEIWSRIFLIDINNSEAVGRIEKTRQEMAEGNRKVTEGLKRGRERFEAGDFSAAREAFLQVLAVDENDPTARAQLDRIEQELARPSSGLDLSKKGPQGDILAEEMLDAAEPDIPELVEAKPREREKDAGKEERPKAPRRPIDKRFAMALGGSLLLAIAVGAYYMMRGSSDKGGGAAAGGGPSLEHATSLFREGKVTETVAELRQIPADSPDYARAQKLLASLTKKSDGGSAAAGSTEGAPSESSRPASGPSPEATHMREEAEKALSEKRYIDALKSFNLAASSFQEDPTFTQAMGTASEKVAELTPAVKLYNEGEYETAVPILWRIFQADRANLDARSYLLRSYYNQGIAQLQNSLFPKAADSFGEVLAIDPNDADAARHKKFAQHYLKSDLDLMGRIYVRHVQQRP